MCAEDLLEDFGLGSGTRTLDLLARVPAERLARQVATYDEIVGESGLAPGGAPARGRVGRRAGFEGRENVPTEGPVLLAANHPGLADSIALFANVPRRDLRVMAAQRPLLAALPHTSRYLIPVPEESPGRLGAVRSAARHLRRGGGGPNLPRGGVEAGPTVASRALEAPP